MSAPVSLPAFVFADLRPAVREALEGPAAEQVLTELTARGWRLRQLRERVGALPVQASPAQDAEVVVAALRALLLARSPQEAYDADVHERAQRAEHERQIRPEPASEHDRARWIAAIRSGLTGRAKVPFGPPVRLRPDCTLCEGEASYFVRRDVHLCTSCVDLLAAGELPRERLTGS